MSSPSMAWHRAPSLLRPPISRASTATSLRQRCTSYLAPSRLASSLTISSTIIPRPHRVREQKHPHVRSLQTATFKPYTLPTPASPSSARNADAPEPSLAGKAADTQAASARSDSRSGLPRLDPGPDAAGLDRASLGAVSSQSGSLDPSPASPSASSSASSSAASSQAPSQDTPPRPARRKLRPRKAALSLSPAAVSQLRSMLAAPDPKLIRIGVKNRGCSGLAYHLEYVDRAGAFDESVEQDGVKVLIDSKALFSIIGSEMDWIEDRLEERFVFKNPNITEQCGCGESFSIS